MESFFNHVMELVSRVRRKVGAGRFDTAMVYSLIGVLVSLILFWLVTRSIMVDLLVLIVAGVVAYGALQAIDGLLGDAPEATTPKAPAKRRTTGAASRSEAS